MATHIHLHKLPSPFAMHRGGQLRDATLAYETWGQLNADKSNAVLILTGLSADSHAAAHDEHDTPGWWQAMIGPDKAIDTNKWFVICASSLGSCKGSTGPCSPMPGIGEPYRFSFPDLCLEDIANASVSLTRSLGIQQLHAAIGPSMGGMTALAYALQYPDEVDHLICISSASRSLPFAIAIRSLQREIIRCDPAWKGGYYEPEEEPASGMLLARKLGLVSYRAAEEWHQRFDRARVKKERRKGEPFEIEFEVESYLDYNARKFVGNFDANSYLYLSRAMDWFDVAEHGGSVNAGLARILVKKALIVGVTTDILFPVGQQQEIAEGLIKAGRCVEFVSIDSINGHDAFLVDREHFCPVIAKFFDPS